MQGIIASSIEDMDCIFSFFESAIAYQKSHNYDLWPVFSRDLIKKEIEDGRNWKITDDKLTLGFFSVLYNDPIIWKERDKDPAVYLHRIVVNPQAKGLKLMTIIREWAIAHARECGKHYVRMDTWGNNENLRNYYISCGYQYIGQQYLENADGLPAHYGGSVLSLFEIKVD